LLCGKFFDELDELHKERTGQTQQIGYQHTLKLQGNQLSMVFYDATTLYFEIEDPGDLRKAIFQIPLHYLSPKENNRLFAYPRKNRDTSWIYLILPKFRVSQR
jgi:hypothetical protein